MAKLNKQLSFYIFLAIFAILVIVAIAAMPGQAADPVEIIELRDRTSKTYSLGGNKYSLDVSLGSVHYKDDPADPNELWKDIDSTIVTSERENWDWQVVKGNWHLLVRDDTTVAVGKAGGWLGFQYIGFGYLDWASKDYEILQTRQAVTPDVTGNKITWTGIFGGDTVLEYIYTADGFKENLYIPQTTRDWLAAYPPSSYGLDNATSYLVGIILCDWIASFPAETAFGVPINWDNINEFIDSGVFWRNPATAQLVTALPLGCAFHESGDPESAVELRYRFFSQSGFHYLLFGAKVTDLNSLPAGTIIIDPTVDEQVGASLDDSHEYESSGGNSPTLTTVKIVAGTSATNRYWGGFRWESGSFPSAGETIDVCYIEIYITSTLWDDMLADWHFQDGTASPSQFSSDDYDITSRTRTDDYTYWAANGMGIGWEQSPSLVDTLQELIDNYSPTAIVAIAKPRTTSFKEVTCRAYDWDSAQAAKLHIEYTGGAAAAGNSWGTVIG